jgi:chromosome segregation ATPase
MTCYNKINIKELFLMENMLNQILEGINGINKRLDNIESRLGKLEENQTIITSYMSSVDSHLQEIEDGVKDIKIDNDFLVEKNAHLEKQVNRINKQLEA